MLLRANAVRAGSEGQRLGRTHHRARGISNSHLHIALAVAIVASSAIAFVIPVTRGGEPGDAGVLAIPPTSGLPQSLQGEAPFAFPPGNSGDEAAAQLTPPLGSGLIPDSLLGEAVKIAAGGAVPIAENESTVMATRSKRVPFTVHEDGFALTYESTEITVGQALSSQGVRISEGDLVWPSIESALTAGAHIYVEHAIPVQLVVGGEDRAINTRGATVSDVLAQAGVNLEPKDRVSPRLGMPVSADMRIRVTTVRDVVDVSEEAIEYASVIQYDAELARGARILAEGGEYGWLRREYSVRQVNGREVRRTLANESYTPPKTEVVTIGTYVAPAAGPVAVPTPAVAAAVSAPQPAPGCSRTLNVYATWYTASSAGGSGVTATGTSVQKGTVAVDPKVIPLGTRMYIPGYGYGIAADTGGGVVGNYIDLGYGPNDVKDWRSRWVDICIL